jgi:hypothetical protein
MFGAFFVGPSGGYANVPLQMNPGADLTVDGTGRFLTLKSESVVATSLSAGNASVSSLSLNGPLTIGSLGSLPTPLYYTSGMWGSSPAWYRIGTWLAPQNGRLLKLNVVACGNGYHVGGGLFPMPSPFELEIFFHTSNGVSFQGDGCYGNGWVISKHVAFPPLGVRVEYGTVGPQITSTGFAFWVAVSGYPGEWLTTVTTRYPWVSNTSGPHSTAPTRSIPLMVSPVMHSVISASAYGPVIGLSTQSAHPPRPAPSDPVTLHPFASSPVTLHPFEQ